MPLPIDSERLVMRAYEPDDVERIHAVLYSDPVARQWTGGPSVTTETRAVIAHYIDAQQRDGYAYWALLERSSGVLVGEAGLKALDDVGPEIEVGYALAVAYWGRGYATEAAHAVLDEAFGPMRLERVYATAHPENTRSRRVLEKLGFRPAPSPPSGGGGGLLYHVLEGRWR